MNTLNQNIKLYFSNIGLEVALYLSKIYLLKMESGYSLMKFYKTFKQEDLVDPADNTKENSWQCCLQT